MAEVVAEAERWQQFQDMGNYSGGNPFDSGGGVSRFREELGQAALPYLIDAVRRRAPEDAFARDALEYYGTEARAASDAVAERALESEWYARTLYLIDPDRALAMGLHRDRRCRGLLCDVAAHHGGSRLAAHLTSLLADSDADLRRLGAGEQMLTLCDRWPELAPVEVLRKLTSDLDYGVQEATRKALAHLHRGEDASRFLTHTDDAERDAPWLGPLPGSERLAPAPGSKDLERRTRAWLLRTHFELLRRRRCAGLPASAVPYRPLALALLEIPPKLWGLDHWVQEELKWLPFVAREARDLELVRELPRLCKHRHLWDSDPVNGILAWFGPPGREAVAAALEAADGEYRKRLESMAAAVAKWRPEPWMSVEGGDDRFLNGRIEDVDDVSAPELLRLQTVDSSAYGCYALALLDDPGNAHAAFQLAWIDRAFGTPILPPRMAWLRDLGVRDEALLAELATPVPIPLPGRRRRGHAAEDRARLAERSGLHGLAAFYGPDGAARERLRAAAARHLDRVRAAVKKLEVQRSGEAEKAYQEGLRLLEMALWGDLASEIAFFREKALVELDRALAADPEHAKAWASKGLALERLQRPAEAEPALAEAVRLDPEDAASWLTLAAVRLDLSRPAEAQPAVEEALRLAPADGGGWHLKARALDALGRPAEAVEAWQQVVSRPPANMLTRGYCRPLNAKLARAASLARAGRETQAAAAYSALLAEERQTLVNGNAPAPFLEALRHLPAARAAFQELVDALTEPEMLCRAGIAYRRAGRLEEALRIFERLLAGRPEHFDGWCGKAETLAGMRRWAEAIPAIERAIALRPAPDPAAARLAARVTEMRDELDKEGSR